ncbi:protein kinase [Acidobacteria bacterium AH-259-D05]|nr:protein kinase [Acidobacteria bacterium AH-259-D05]
MIGTTISHYEILEKIGEGGMGTVYRATDTKLNRDVALKFLPEQFASDSQRMGRFQREAEVLASLDHPNIGQIYGIEEAGQTKALVLQLIEGPTLADRIAQGPIPVEEALKIALQIAEGLEAAHEKGVIHRDLKPANIKITPEGQVKILDFGLAKAMEAEVPDSSLSQSPTLTNAATQAGVILGTAAYMSPEQARGEATDKKADVWAFGCVLFEMLTRQATFGGKTVSDVLAGVLRIDPEWKSLPPNLHPQIRLLLERSLEKESKDRYHDIADARLDIQKALADPSGVLVQPVAEVAQAAPQSKLPWVAAIVLGIVVAGVAGWSLRPPEPGPISRFYHVLPEGQTFTSTLRTVVAVPPDSSRMVYVASNQLYVRAMDALDSTPIPGTEENPANPFFSPDGQWVGYFSRIEGQLKKIAVSGGAPVTLSDAEIPYGTPFWGTDGMILWSQSEGIMRVSANGGTPELLISDPEGIIAWPQMLPGGRSVLLSRSSNWPASGQVVVYSLESGEQKVLFAGVYGKYVSTGHIVYTVDDVLFAVPFDLDTLEVVGGPVAMVQGVRGDPPQYAVSDSGSLVFVPGGAGGLSERSTLGLVDRNGEVELLNVPTKEYLSPRLSPDGQTLVVQSVEDSGNVIWVYALTGDTAIQQLTFEGNNDRPVWTPDSQRITFSSDRDGTMSLYWMPADGSGVAERLTTAEEGTTHQMGSWSPDGDLLVFNVNDAQGDWDIWTLSVDDRETQSLYDTPGTIYPGAELSPNGEWLAYGAGSNFPAIDIYVEPFPPTGSRRRISQGGGLFPLWSPEGSELFYRPGSGSGRVFLRSVDIVTEPSFAFSNEQTLPAEGFTVARGYRDYDMSPDGERLLMVFPADRPDPGEASRPQINIILNWFEELKERVPVP